MAHEHCWQGCPGRNLPEGSPRPKYRGPLPGRSQGAAKHKTTCYAGNVVNLRSFIYKTTYDFIGFQHESFKYTHKKTTITKKVIVSSFISID